jgi:hypothetical protein
VSGKREQRARFADWVRHEVQPFSAFWCKRLELDDRGVALLSRMAAADESELSGAGGPGNPALLLLPSEDEFKRSARRAELWAAAREVAGLGVDGRRAALARRYKPVHVHDAGVAAPLAIAYTRTDLDRLHLAGARLAGVLGLTSDDALINAVPAAPTVRFWGLYHAALACRMTALHPRSPGGDPLRAVARAFALLPATVLAAPVAEAEALLAGLAERRVDASAVRTVLTVGAPPSPGQRAVLTAAAEELAGRAVRVQAVWAPETARALWGECRPAAGDPPEATYGLHTYPDLEILEVRDVLAGRLAPEAEPGELLYTSLGWRGTALLRFATGSWTGGLVTSVPCPACGRTVPRLAPAVRGGAWQPRVRTGDQTQRVDLRRAAEALGPERLRLLRVRDWSLRAADGRLVLGVDASETAAETLARSVATAVGVAPEVRLSPDAAAVRPQLGDAGVELEPVRAGR